MDRELDQSMRKASGVLFLCSGNMVRSAFAELFAAHRGCPLPVRSAATIYRNGRILRETAEALRARGVARESIARFRPTHLSDVIGTLGPDVVAFGMSRQHLAALEPRAAWRGRAHLLARVLGRDEEIPDPVLEGADFERTFETLERCVDVLVASLRGDATGPDR